MKTLKPGIYRHYKGGLYLVLGLAQHSETAERLVAYVPLSVQVGPRIMVRPYDMFLETVKVNGEQRPRFEYVGEEISPEMAQQHGKMDENKPAEKID